MVTLSAAKKALLEAGFKVQIDSDSDGFVGLYASKDGACVDFYDTKLDSSSSYLGFYSDSESIVSRCLRAVDERVKSRESNILNDLM